MTEREKRAKIQEREKTSLPQIAFCTLSIIALILTFAFTDSVVSAMSRGLSLCLYSLVPSLFPFMVLSELFVLSGASRFVGKFLAKPLSFVFGVSEEGASAVLLGFLCGFPIGQKCALSLYKSGRISKGELEHLSMFVNNPSSAFLMGAVGVSLFGDKLFGILLFSSQLISSCIVGFGGRFYFSGRKEERLLLTNESEKEQKGIFASVISAVLRSTSSMLLICAFVVFFSSILGVITLFLSALSFPPALSSAVLGLLEMSNGISSAVSLPISAAVPLTAAMSAWSGLSVHMQLIAVCGDTRLSFKPYFLGKAAGVLLCPLVLSLLMGIFGKNIDFSQAGTVNSFLDFTLTPFSVGVLFTFAFFALLLALNAKKSAKL